MTRTIAWALMGALLARAVALGATVQVEGLQRRMWGGRQVRIQVRAEGLPEDEEAVMIAGVEYDEVVAVWWRRAVEGDGVIELDVQLPAVTARVSAAFTLEIRQGDDVVVRHEQPIDLYPPGALDGVVAAYEDLAIGLVAPGLSRDEAAELFPLPHVLLSSAPAIRQFEDELLFLITAEPLGRRSGVAAALLARVEEGARLICLGASGSPLPIDWAGGAPDAEAVTKARLLAPAHPLAAGLAPADLTDWAPDGVVAPMPVPWPTGGNYLAIADVPGSVAGEGADMPTAVAVELRYGEGMILICGAAVLARLRDEPVAELMLAGAVRWGLGASPVLPEAAVDPAEPAGYPAEAAGVFQEDSTVAAALARLGVPCEAHPGPDVPLLGDSQLLSDEVEDLLARVLQEGGTVVLFALGEDELAPLNDALRRRWAHDTRAETPELALVPLSGRDVSTGFEPGAHPLSAGMRPEDVQTMTEGLDELEVLVPTAVADAEHFVNVLGYGLVAKLERDDVHLYFWQVPLSDEEAPEHDRVLSAFLSNLGIRMMPPE